MPTLRSIPNSPNETRMFSLHETAVKQALRQTVVGAGVSVNLEAGRGRGRGVGYADRIRTCDRDGIGGVRFWILGIR